MCRALGTAETDQNAIRPLSAGFTLHRWAFFITLPPATTSNTLQLHHGKGTMTWPLYSWWQTPGEGQFFTPNLISDTEGGEVQWKVPMAHIVRRSIYQKKECSVLNKQRHLRMEGTIFARLWAIWISRCNGPQTLFSLFIPWWVLLFLWQLPTKILLMPSNLLPPPVFPHSTCCPNWGLALPYKALLCLRLSRKGCIFHPPPHPYIDAVYFNTGEAVFCSPCHLSGSRKKGVPICALLWLLSSFLCLGFTGLLSLWIFIKIKK